MKDALGDSGMLLDTDATINKSPNTSPSQVHNIYIYKNDNKILQGNRHVQLQPQVHHVSNIQTEGKVASLPKYDLISQHKSFRNNENFVNGTVSEMRYINRKVHKLQVNNVVKMSPAAQFNPYADENDSNNKFQLSKSSLGSSQRPDAQQFNLIDTKDRSRLFGNDKTNLIQLDRPTNMNNYRREHNMILKNPNTLFTGTEDYSQGTQNIHDNTIMFRNYDLNDEYWLNFE